MSATQMTFDTAVIRPVIVPTCDVDHGEEYNENDPVYWNNQSWEVLDWDFEHNAFVLLSDADWETYIHSPHSKELRAAILEQVWSQQ